MLAIRAHAHRAARAIILLPCRTLISAIGALRDALLLANADPEKVTSVAGYENQLAVMRSDLRVLKWMVGLLFPIVIVILWRVYPAR
jgi:hypothetical protein